MICHCNHKIIGYYNKFTDYIILETYLTNDGEFPPQLWAKYVSSTIRITNNCESFHKKLNSSFNSSHPNIFNFLKIRKKGIKIKKMSKKEIFI